MDLSYVGYHVCKKEISKHITAYQDRFALMLWNLII